MSRIRKIAASGLGRRSRAALPMSPPGAGGRLVTLPTSFDRAHWQRPS